MACFLFFHDWEYIDRITPTQLESNLRHEDEYCDKGEPTPPPVRVINDEKMLHRRVCLKCGRVEDQITPYIDYYRIELEHNKTRFQKAKEIWNDYIQKQSSKES